MKVSTILRFLRYYNWLFSYIFIIIYLLCSISTYEGLKDIDSLTLFAVIMIILNFTMIQKKNMLLFLIDTIAIVLVIFSVLDNNYKIKAKTNDLNSGVNCLNYLKLGNLKRYKSCRQIEDQLQQDVLNKRLYSFSLLILGKLFRILLSAVLMLRHKLWKTGTVTLVFVFIFGSIFIGQTNLDTLIFIDRFLILTMLVSNLENFYFDFSKEIRRNCLYRGLKKGNLPCLKNIIEEMNITTEVRVKIFNSPINHIRLDPEGQIFNEKSLENYINGEHLTLKPLNFFQKIYVTFLLSGKPDDEKNYLINDKGYHVFFGNYLYSRLFDRQAYTKNIEIFDHAINLINCKSRNVVCEYVKKKKVRDCKSFNFERFTKLIAFLKVNLGKSLPYFLKDKNVKLLEFKFDYYVPRISVESNDNVNETESLFLRKTALYSDKYTILVDGGKVDEEGAELKFVHNETKIKSLKTKTISNLNVVQLGHNVKIESIDKIIMQIKLICNNLKRKAVIRNDDKTKVLELIRRYDRHIPVNEKSKFIKIINKKSRDMKYVKNKSDISNTINLKYSKGEHKKKQVEDGNTVEYYSPNYTKKSQEILKKDIRLYRILSKPNYNYKVYSPTIKDFKDKNSKLLIKCKEGYLHGLNKRVLNQKVDIRYLPNPAISFKYAYNDLYGLIYKAEEKFGKNKIQIFDKITNELVFTNQIKN